MTIVSIGNISKGPFAPRGRSGGNESVSNEFRCICGLNSFYYHHSYLHMQMSPKGPRCLNDCEKFQFTRKLESLFRFTLWDERKGTKASLEFII